MAFTEFDQKTLTGHGDAERLTGTSASEGFFEMLGVPPRLGRWFTPQEQKPGADHVVLLSHGFWMRTMGGRPEAVGSTLFLSGIPYRITGVMPASFRFNTWYAAEYWTPIRYVSYGHQNHQYAGYGRLKPGVAIQAAQAQMSEIARRMEQEFSDCAGWRVRVVSLRSDFLKEFSPALRIFAAAALIVLLVACGNVASLLLARGIGRSKEIAVRPALAGFAIGLTLSTGLLTGLWPALRGSRGNLQTELKESGNFLVARRQQARALNSLVVMEIALAVVLLTFAGLLTKSFAYLLHSDLGYRADGLLTFQMALPSSRYKNDQARVQFWDTLLPQLAALPGVVSAAAADGVPLGGTYDGTPVEVEGQTPARDWAEATTRDSTVTADYFRTIGIPLQAGRAFTEVDTADAERVAMVNETFVRKLMHGASPLGKHVRLGQGKWLRIVGVIGDIRYQGPAQPSEAEAYLPFTQDVPSWFEFVTMRTAVPENGVFGAVRDIVRRMDPGLPITEVRTMRQSIDLATAMPRAMMALVVGFAVVTLGMATLGQAAMLFT